MGEPEDVDAMLEEALDKIEDSDRNYGHGHAEPMAALIRGEVLKKEELSGEGGEETPNAANGTEKMDAEDGTTLSQSKKKKDSSEHKKRSRSRSSSLCRQHLTG